MTYERPSLLDRVRLLILSVAFAVLGPALPGWAGEPPSVMIIFDGSGSMWGRLDGDKKTAKLDLAREALRAALTKAAPDTRFGLMSFGHRRSGDCSDVEVIAPLAVGDLPRVMTPLDKLNPRGKGPITAALREAAEALGTAPQSSIILIHDNADNCRQEPCEFASEIAASHPALKIHLVSLGIDKDELARVACVPKSTGGRLFDVHDSGELQAALSEAVNLAFLDPGAPAPLAAATGLPAPPQAAPLNPSGPPGLVLTARLAAGTPQLTVPVQWRVVKAGTEQVAFEAAASTATAPLPAGSYTVEGTVGFATGRKTVDVTEPGPTRVELSLEASALRVLVRDLKDGPVSNGPLISLKQTEPAGAPPLRPLWIGRAQDADFVIPAGTYTVHVAESLAQRDDTLTLAAGAVQTLDVVMGSGRLELSASAKPDGPLLDGVTFLIASDDPEQPDGRREIARSAATKPAFVLPAGTYYVTARSGLAEVRQRIGVGAGDTIKRQISLGLSKLVIGADVPVGRKDASTQSKLPIATRILSLDAEPREVARATALAPEFTLAPGRYRIEASVGGGNVKATQDVELESGGTRRIGLKLDANTLQLKLSPQPSPGPGADMAWEVRDSQGGVLLRSSLASPSVILAPGRYTARLDIRDQRLEKTVDLVTDGQPRIVEFALP